MRSHKDADTGRKTDATFVVRMMYRQHSSWQGEVTWIDREKKEYFRSAMELIKLLDSAVNASKENDVK